MHKMEDLLSWRGDIEPFDIVCMESGFMYQDFKDEGEYVEATEHRAIVNIYRSEVALLRQIIECGKLTDDWEINS